jgi:hypothetical protein
MQPISSPPGHWPGQRFVRALLFAVFLVALGLVAVAMLGNAQFVEAREECRALARAESPAALGPFCAGLERGEMLWSWSLGLGLATAGLTVWAWVATHRRR